MAVEALGQIGDRRAVPVLINVLEGVDRPAVSRAIEGCGDQWDEEMLTLAAAVRALGAIRDETAVPSLMKALRHTVTRAEAARYLTRFGSTVIAPLLAVLAHESDDNIHLPRQGHIGQSGLARWSCVADCKTQSSPLTLCRF